MSSSRKRAYAHKASVEVSHLKQRLALVERHCAELTTFAEVAARKADEYKGLWRKAMIDWQPIKTAPRDGTLILLAQEMEPGFWEYESGFYSTTWGFGGGHAVCFPTHWAPITPPNECCD